MFEGVGVTVVRNAGLFSAFVTYIDITKNQLNLGLSPFFTGAICANLAWLTIWPLDVVKSMRQSGNYNNQSNLDLMRMLIRERTLFKGVMPGLLRSSIANGCAMTVYTKVTKEMSKRWKE